MSESQAFDVVVLGSGVAGAMTALECAGRGARRVGLVTKSELGISTTQLSQGGISVPGAIGDSTQLHLSDTLVAGAGLCDLEATTFLVDHGTEAFEELVRHGAIFDREANGDYSRSREGGHSLARVIHAGGAATGIEIVRALSQAVRTSSIEVLENTFVVDLLVEGGSCRGVVALDGSGCQIEIESEVVVIACGGTGQLFEVTTNPPTATGDGVAMALRAGAVVADVEFVQFHPTALHIDRWPRPLLSEALRGAGATLKNEAEERFVDELSSRDVVSRAIADEIVASNSDHVYLDVSAIEQFSSRFPSLTQILFDAGLDPASDLLPVAPAAHYLCGGVLCDLDGLSTIENLFVVGETACSGVQGANRLASNSLLEGLVFARRVAAAIADGRRRASWSGAMRGRSPSTNPSGSIPVRDVVLEPLAFEPGEIDTDRRRTVGEIRRELATMMTRQAGVVRTREGLASARQWLGEMNHELVPASSSDAEALELRNLAVVAEALVDAASRRLESRGAQTRADYPERDDEHFLCRFGITVGS